MENRLAGLWREYRGFVLFIALMVVFRGAMADWNVVPSYGFVPREEIIGSTRTVVLSLDYEHHYLPRFGRFFHDIDTH